MHAEMRSHKSENIGSCPSLQNVSTRLCRDHARLEELDITEDLLRQCLLAAGVRPTTDPDVFGIPVPDLFAVR